LTYIYVTYIFKTYQRHTNEETTMILDNTNPHAHKSYEIK